MNFFLNDVIFLYEHNSFLRYLLYFLLKVKTDGKSISIHFGTSSRAFYVTMNFSDLHGFSSTIR